MHIFILLILISFNTSFASGPEPINALTDKDFREICPKALMLNSRNDISAAYMLFANKGDVYAVAAENIFNTKKVTMERCVIQAHWLNVVGKKVKDEKFNEYGQYYQSTYINFVCNSKNNPKHLLPTSDQIENLYGEALKVKKLPDILSIDKVLNRQERNTINRKLQHTGTMGIKMDLAIGTEWYHAIHLNKDRWSTKQHKADISPNEANRLAMMTSLSAIPVCAELETKEKLHAIANSAMETFNTVATWVNPPAPDCLPKH